MERRVIREMSDWATMRAAFEWDVPEHFNMAERLCDSWALAEPNRVAIIHVGDDTSVKTWTYGELKHASDRLAMSLRTRGVKRGDRVAVLLAQSPEVLISHFAVMKLGAVILPLFTLFGEDALRYRLADNGARVVVTDGENLDKVQSLRGDLPEVSEVYCTDGGTGSVLGYYDEIDAAPDGFQPVNTLAEDPAMLIYTSGTTGPPKGVLHAHRFLIGHLPSMETHHPNFGQAGDVGWTPADWAWIGGLMDMAVPCMYYGVPLVSHRMRKFDAGAAFSLIAEHQINRLFMPPTALKLMRQSGTPEGLSIRTISSGGESLGADLLDWGLKALGAPINEIYGQTECNLILASVDGAMEVRPGAMGQAVPGFDVAVIDADGEVLPDGEMGEVAVKVPNPVMFLRYWNKPEKTDEKYVNGWLRTGDLGTCDADGYFTYLSRDDDVITSAGYRIGPSEIENCLCSHPDVVMAAVIGVPDELRTEIVKAFVVLSEGAEWHGLERVLIDLVKARVSPHVAPRIVAPIDALPMTTTGKIMRRELRGLK